MCGSILLKEHTGKVCEGNIKEIFTEYLEYTVNMEGHYRRYNRDINGM